LHAAVCPVVSTVDERDTAADLSHSADTTQGTTISIQVLAGIASAGVVAITIFVVLIISKCKGEKEETKYMSNAMIPQRNGNQSAQLFSSPPKAGF